MSLFSRKPEFIAPGPAPQADAEGFVLGCTNAEGRLFRRLTESDGWAADAALLVPRAIRALGLDLHVIGEPERATGPVERTANPTDMGLVRQVASALVNLGEKSHKRAEDAATKAVASGATTFEDAFRMAIGLLK